MDDSPPTRRPRHWIRWILAAAVALGGVWMAVPIWGHVSATYMEFHVLNDLDRTVQVASCEERDCKTGSHPRLVGPDEGLPMSYTWSEDDPPTYGYVLTTKAGKRLGCVLARFPDYDENRVIRASEATRRCTEPTDGSPEPADLSVTKLNDTGRACEDKPWITSDANGFTFCPG